MAEAGQEPLVAGRLTRAWCPGGRHPQGPRRLGPHATHHGRGRRAHASGGGQPLPPPAHRRRAREPRPGVVRQDQGDRARSRSIHGLAVGLGRRLPALPGGAAPELQAREHPGCPWGAARRERLRDRHPVSPGGRAAPCRCLHPPHAHRGAGARAAFGLESRPPGHGHLGLGLLRGVPDHPRLRLLPRGQQRRGGLPGDLRAVGSAGSGPHLEGAAALRGPRLGPPQVGEVCQADWPRRRDAEARLPRHRPVGADVGS
mmetsp:Transcript_167109/g.536708  ORF Transcript_167109/g.536708 Transcript_167109/m.536708 type:complete len:258 (-) Transcript_167109:1361-2134(-)